MSFFESLKRLFGSTVQQGGSGGTGSPGNSGSVGETAVAMIPCDEASARLFEYLDGEREAEIVALTVGIVLFTLLSGGLTMGPLIQLMGLNRPSLVDRMAHAQGACAAKQEALARVEGLATAGHFSHRIIEDIASRYRQELAEARKGLDNLCAGPEFRQDATKLVLLMQSATVEHRTYHDLFARGQISEAVLRELDLGIDLERDILKRGEVCERLPVTEPMEVRLTSVWMSWVQRLAPASRAVQQHRLRALAANYERDSAILAASEAVGEAIERLGELSNVEPAIRATCRGVYERRAEQAMDRIDSLAEHFPEYASAVQERTARRIALDAESDAIERLATAGGLPEGVVREARHAVEQEKRRLARRPVKAVEPDPKELLTKVPFFQGLAAGDFDRVAQRLIPKTVLTGERIITQGQRGTSLFLIARGVVAVLIAVDGEPPKRVASLHAGDFFGEMALLSDGPRSATVKAITACQLYELARHDVDALCKVCPGVKEALRQADQERREVGGAVGR